MVSLLSSLSALVMLRNQLNIAKISCLNSAHSDTYYIVLAFGLSDYSFGAFGESLRFVNCPK